VLQNVVEKGTLATQKSERKRYTTDILGQRKDVEKLAEQLIYTF